MLFFYFVSCELNYRRLLWVGRKAPENPAARCSGQFSSFGSDRYFTCSFFTFLLPIRYGTGRGSLPVFTLWQSIVPVNFLLCLCIPVIRAFEICLVLSHNSVSSIYFIFTFLTKNIDSNEDIELLYFYLILWITVIAGTIIHPSSVMYLGIYVPHSAQELQIILIFTCGRCWRCTRARWPLAEGAVPSRNSNVWAAVLKACSTQR